ncbi:hypothetical protein Cpir12675_002259 [Ceratocystis pirilliformis]|uniref:Vegetative cell wall protein gp1 n=1 Tax=Ceratocystis pirilliformis TaxID=259994 RepID=A0ABR3ZB14_9PEZI
MSGLGPAPPHAEMPPYPGYMNTGFRPDPYHSPPGTTHSSPRGTPYNPYFAVPPPRAASTQSPQRPATRAHFRTTSTTATPVYCEYNSPRPPTASPRYNSDGQYATANVSNGLYSRNFPSFASSPLQPNHSRRHSFIPTRDSTPSGESDEEFFNRDGALVYTATSGRGRRSDYHLPGSSGLAPRRRRNSFGDDAMREHATDRELSQAGPYHSMHDGYDKPSGRHQGMSSRPTTATRRPSMTTPQRPATTAPRSNHKKSTSSAAPPAAKPRAATEADARKHGIPSGYSLKNWDPTQDPILLLGSVFDANSLGKWVYDWTVHHHGAARTEAEIAGKLWLFLIQMYGKIRTGDQIVQNIRSRKSREMVEEFLNSGDRLIERLRKLLKSCEAPMLRAAESHKGGLGSNSGIEFVKTLFGEDKQLKETKSFIRALETFIRRWDANCEDIIHNPTQ